ncbi:MAG: hypothetical protein AB7T49_12490 [Oligoflexales bacterium]
MIKKLLILSLAASNVGLAQYDESNNYAEGQTADSANAEGGYDADEQEAAQSDHEGVGQRVATTQELPLTEAQEKDAKELELATPKTLRLFHEVLDELLVEFGYDVKMKQLGGLKNLSVRRVIVSDSLPKSYSIYLESLIEERIRENSRMRLVNCLPCKTKTSRLVNSSLQITSPLTNVAEMNRAAEELGIENFMDVTFVYHTTHMVLAFQIFDTQTKELLWARTYNSETVKSRYQRLAIDYSQVKQSRDSDEYQPDFRYTAGLGAASIPNLSDNPDDKSMLALQFRGTEKFNNRSSEFGLMLSLYNATSSLLSDYPAQGEPETEAAEDDANFELEPFTTALAINAIFGHNFLRSIESYNEVRHGIHMGLGAFLASGYFAGTGRAGWDVFFGKTFIMSTSLVYIAASSVLVKNETVKTKGGAGGELVLSYNF